MFGTWKSCGLRHCRCIDQWDIPVKPSKPTPAWRFRVYPNLKLQLWRSGIRQNRLAQMLGVDETMLSKVINGYRTASPELRAKIAGILQSEEKWLFESISATKPDLNDPACA